VTPILHSPEVLPKRRPTLVLLSLIVAGCASSRLAAAKPPAPAPGAETTKTPPSGRAAPYDGPATTFGRALLAQADAVVRGTLTSVMTIGGGAEVGRLAATEWIRGLPTEEGAPATVLSEEIGVLPAAGRECVLVLRVLPASPNWGLVEVVPLDDDDGPDRLAALRKFLDIEEIPDAAPRLAALCAYLRGAVVSDHRFTRWNAAREYAALAREVPGALGAEDRAPLERARDHALEKSLRALLQTAIDACPGGSTRTPTLAARPAAADGGDEELRSYAARYSAPGAPPASRRQAVIEAATGLGARGAPLFATALADPDATVREAAAASAAQFRVASLEPKVASMLATDGSPLVRRALVVAAGRLRSAASVPSLALLAKEESPVARDAAFALARVRNDAALKELRAQRADARTKDRIELLDFLLSDAFLAQEHALGD